jgi:uncharacterized protein (TIRG00374 family)
LPYGLVNWLEAISWKCIIINLPRKISLSRLFWWRLGGEALNQLTPAASLGGEPFKAARLQAAGVPLDQATASVVIHKGILVLSLVLYIILGLALAPVYLPAALGHLQILSLGTLGLAVGGGLFIFLQQRGASCSQGIAFLNRRPWCPKFLQEKEGFFAGLDSSLSSFYWEYPGRAALALTLFFFSWVLHAVEVFLIFRLVGHPIGWGLAICLDSLAMLFTAMGFFIPAAAGVQEGGNLLLALGFKLGLALGATFSILRRLREAFWLSLGLLVVWQEK